MLSIRSLFKKTKYNGIWYVAIEETGSINKAAEKLGFAYSSLRCAAGRHGLDISLYTRRTSAERAADTVTMPARPKDPPAIAGSMAGLGDVLIGAGLVMIGAWLKSKEQ